MSDPSRFAPSMRGTFACAALMLGLAAGACAGPGDGAPAETRSAVATGTGASRNLDVLFVVDDAPGMEPMQQALYDQIPTFMEMLSNPVSGLGNLHIGVISADVGAPGDASASLGCTTTGDTGKLQSVPRGGCTDSTITPGDSFISFVAGVPNFEQDSMAEVSISNVLRCILPLGGGGCMFQQPLAAIARALGADGAPPPAVNTGFLRPDAALVIFILSNQDDCSAPASSALFSLGGKADDLANPLGPLAHYRCNAFGHLCVDPSGDPTAHISPPLTPPADAQGTAAAPTLDLVQCASNESGAYLTPVSSLLSEIRSLK
ncbi:MAG TPA: hypothetical protein VHO06_05895, partial [Polyangia bacterium]|nr:hypothetical protein [Polyangia bacterium]